MVPTVNVFADSSLLVEYIKETETDLLEFLISNSETIYINNAVLSEFFFHFLASKGKKSPLTIKMNSEIDSLMKAAEYEAFLEQFTFATDAPSLVKKIPQLMKSYNLLPNDALILATCLPHSLPYLASYDINDFATACQAEGITLLDSVATAQQHLTQP